MVLGTVAYVSPEQVARGVSDARTDVYSAGVVLFELLTGTPPYGGDSALAVAYRHVHDDVPAPSTRVAGIPPALDELVLRATRREPGGRPADAGVLPGRAGHGPHRPRAAPGAVPGGRQRVRDRGADRPGRSGAAHRADRAGAVRAARDDSAAGVRPAGAAARTAPARGEPGRPGRRQRLAGRAAAPAHLELGRARGRAARGALGRHGGLVVRQRAVRGGAVADPADPGPGRGPAGRRRPDRGGSTRSRARPSPPGGWSGPSRRRAAGCCAATR